MHPVAAATFVALGYALLIGGLVTWQPWVGVTVAGALLLAAGLLVDTGSAE